MNKKRRGFSLVETMLTSTVMALVIAGAAMLVVNMIRSYNWTSAQMDSDHSASQALQGLARDLQEAKQVTVLSTTSIRVFYPQVAGDGTYIQNITDTVNYLDFYRGNSNGTASPTGTCLVRKTATGAARVICKKVTDVTFATVSPSSIEATIRTANTKGSAVTNCQMVQRSIFMRNY